VSIGAALDRSLVEKTGRQAEGVSGMDGLHTALTGRGLLESPRWHGDSWYVSDWTAGEVLALDDRGGVEVVARVHSLPLCTAWLPDGRLLVVSSAEGQLLRLEADGTLTTYADLGRPGWTDIVVDGRGNAYVNGAGFDPVAGEDFRPGHVALVRPDGSVLEVADGIQFPNGMAVTPDNATLIVADSYAHALVAFDIGDGGSLTGRRTWADLGDGTPDGICVDAEGAVWYADVPNEQCVRVAEGGTVLRTIVLDRGGFACALGGPEGRTLCIVAAEWRGMTELVTPGSGLVLLTEVEVPGAGWP
jgi:sugar lactone lactonase YvrE